MGKRYVSIWFRHLVTDWFVVRHPHLRNTAFVIAAPIHGRMVITAVNHLAELQGIQPAMVLADARAIHPSIQVLDDHPGLTGKLLIRLAEWCIRFTPVVAIDAPDGLLFDATGCAHLWGSESAYLTAITDRLSKRGYQVRTAMADTIGAAWAMARYGKQPLVIASGEHTTALLSLPAAALRLDYTIVERLQKLGLREVRDFLHMPAPALRRRFGTGMIQKLQQALGQEEEFIEPVWPLEPYQERLPCLDPIVTATGIEIALKRLLDIICMQLQKEEKGLRMARFSYYRVDGKKGQLEVGTHRPSHNASHLYKLFENKLDSIEPGPGIELFVFDALKVEEHAALPVSMWTSSQGLEDNRLAELIDQLAGRVGAQQIRRYLPAEHYWPERSIQPALSLEQKPAISWKLDRPRPMQLLSSPEPIEVTAPVPDYPPMLFRYKGQLHTIKKADGPERIEQEWWIQQGEHRDYYSVEDEQGCRYWLFRSGHYIPGKSYQWFLHGFFA